jgi:hypothetical protein
VPKESSRESDFSGVEYYPTVVNIVKGKMHKKKKDIVEKGTDSSL